MKLENLNQGFWRKFRFRRSLFCHGRPAAARQPGLQAVQQDVAVAVAGQRQQRGQQPGRGRHHDTNLQEFRVAARGQFILSN